MGRYLVARLLAMIPTLLLLLLAVVMLVRLLPGNAVDALMAQAAASSGATENSQAARGALAAQLGLNKSLPDQYLTYALGAAHGDLGQSVATREPVTRMILRALPVTLVLSVLALTWATVLGVGIGLVSAARQGGVVDHALRAFAILGLSVPNFALGTFLIVMPTIWWRWSPPVHFTPFALANLWTYVSQYFTAAFVLGLALSAALMRLSRTELLSVLREDYVRTARAKGLRGSLVVLRHALPNALIPVVSQLGLQVGFLISGSVIIEQIFGLPGIGRLLLQSIATRDYPTVQAIAATAGLVFIVVNLLVDISYGVLNPRIRLGASA